MASSDAGEKSPASLAPPAEIVVPSTPIPARATTSPSPDTPRGNIAAPQKENWVSLAPRGSSSEMTPPPSSRHGPNAVTPPRRSRSDSNQFLASPPATIDQTLCVAYGASENLPTVEDIDFADHAKLRKMAKDLLIFAQDFRMSAAHFKLQNSLLSLTSSEAVKRAEVEQRLARREVEILQSEEYRNRNQLGLSKSYQPSPNDQLENALKRIKDLEQSNLTLERRLRRAKKLIEEETERNELLTEENSRLKQRICDNRQHFTRMLDHGSLASTPRTEFLTPQRKSTTRYQDTPCSHISRVGNQDPFAALLAADQVLSGENASVPSTPAQNRSQNLHHNGHTRGTHSLSSLPVTPSHGRHTEANHHHFLTPVNKRASESRLSHSTTHLREEGRRHEERSRHDRDSTISDEEAVTDDDVPASQASSLATSMLRRYPGSSQDEVPVPANIGKSSSILQSKLFGQVKKAGVDRAAENLKRKSGYGERDLPSKKIRTGERVGLGIEP